MPDIVTGKVFVDGEKGITATKLNQIQSLAVIQPSFYSNKASSSTLDPTDTLLELKSSGSYAQITGSQLISSVSGQVNILPQIYSVRLRTFNSLGNPNFEIDSRTCGNGSAAAAGWAQDRWYYSKHGTMTYSVVGQQDASSAPIVLPGQPNFTISRNYFRFTLNVTEPTLGATDYTSLTQWVEGPQLRELISDVHSLSILVRTSVSGLTFGVSIQDVSSPPAHSLCLLGTVASANTWTLLSWPNLPVWATGGTFNLKSGTIGYTLNITLAAGSTYMAPANNTWQNGDYIGASGQSNFANNVSGSTFDIAMIQHEPGSVATVFVDKPFLQNREESLRYFFKSYPFSVVPGSATFLGSNGCFYAVSATASNGYAPFLKTMPPVNPSGYGPGVSIYNPSTGVLNSVYNGGTGAAIPVTGANYISDSGFSQITGTGFAGQNMVFQYTADSGF